LIYVDEIGAEALAIFGRGNLADLPVRIILTAAPAEKALT